MARIEDLAQRISQSIPPRLAWPLSAASTVLAIVAAGLIFGAAALGSATLTIASLVVFVAAGALWYAADIAQGRSEASDV